MLKEFMVECLWWEGLRAGAGSVTSLPRGEKGMTKTVCDELTTDAKP